MKICTDCKLSKPIESFTKRLDRPIGIQATCKQCSAIRTAKNRIKNKDKVLERTREWNHSNKGKKNALTAKRNAAKRQRSPRWLTSLHYQQIEMFYKSAADLTRELGIPMNVDHVVPLQGKNVSGLHVPWNLQVISESENAKKHNTYK